MQKIVAIILLGWTISSCQPKGVTEILLPKPVESTYAYSQVEPCVAIHPKDNNQIAVASVMNDFYYSKDGGRTWHTESVQSPYGVNGDPVLIFDTLGNLHFFHLASLSKKQHLDRIVCQTRDAQTGEFTDGTFPKPSGKKVQDKHWVCVNPINNHLYMTWTQFDSYGSKLSTDSSIIVFSKSIDQGESWSDPQRISKFGGDCLDDDNSVEGAFPAVGKNGEIYVIWAGPRGLVMQVSKDEGHTWLEEEMPLYDQVGGWTLKIPGINRANGLPILKVNPINGHLYLNWADQREGENNTNVYLAVSEDGGISWGKPILVNSDQNERHQFFTWMEIDPMDGSIYFVYYDRDKTKENATNITATRSIDEGKTFQDIRLNKKSFVPNEKVFFGDYLSIAAVNGCIRAVYPRMDEGKISLYIALLNERDFSKQKIRLAGQ